MLPTLMNESIHNHKGSGVHLALIETSIFELPLAFYSPPEKYLRTPVLEEI